MKPSAVLAVLLSCLLPSGVFAQNYSAYRAAADSSAAGAPRFVQIEPQALGAFTSPSPSAQLLAPSLTVPSAALSPVPDFPQEGASQEQAPGSAAPAIGGAIAPASAAAPASADPSSRGPQKVRQKIAALAAAVAAANFDSAHPDSNGDWLSSHIGSPFRKVRPFFWNWLTGPEQSYGTQGLHDRMAVLKLEAIAKRETRQAEGRVSELRLAVNRETQLRREINQLSSGVYRALSRGQENGDLQNELTAKRDELRLWETAIQNERLNIQNRILDRNVAPELDGLQTNEVWLGRTLARARAARDRTAQEIATATRRLEIQPNAVLNKKLALLHRDLAYLDQVLAEGGLSRILSRMSAEIAADAKDRLLPEGLLPSAKSTGYEWAMRTLQAAYALATLVVLHVSWWFAVPIAITGYYTIWPVMQKLVTLVVQAAAKPTGHPMLSMAEMSAAVDRHYVLTGTPYTVAILIPKFSGSKAEFDVWEQYVRADIATLNHTLGYLGEKFRVVFICASNTNTAGKDGGAAGNAIADYEQQRIEALNTEFRSGSQGQISFLYLRRNSGWFSKVGNVLGAMRLLTDGSTSSRGYTDKTQWGENASPTGPIYDRAAGPFSDFFGGETDEKARRAILDGERLVFDQSLTPEFTVVLDDKNQLGVGAFEKWLRIMMHPANRGIVIGTPTIEITPPTNEKGEVVSVTLESERMARQSSNSSEIRTIDSLYQRAASYYGKGIVRTRDWVRVVADTESLSAKYTRLSHDWVESVLVWTESMSGSGLKVRHQSVSETETLVQAERGREIELYKVVANGPDAELWEYRGGRFAFVRVFAGVLSAAHPVDRFIETELAGFLGDNVDIGERDLLSFFSRLQRDLRWLLGDVHMVKAIKPYASAISPRARLHLNALERRFLGAPAFGSWIALLHLAVLAHLSSLCMPVGAALLLGVTMVGIIGVDKFLVPFFYARSLLVQARQTGARIGLKVYAGMAYGILNSGLALTIYSTLISLTNLITSPRSGAKTLSADARDVAVNWSNSSTNSRLSALDQIGIPLSSHYKEFRLHVGVGIGIVLLSMPLTAMNIIHASILLPAALGIYLLSLILGPAAMYLAAIPNKKIFSHYPVLAAAATAAGFVWGSFAVAFAVFLVSFFIAETLTMPSLRKKWKEWRGR